MRNQIPPVLIVFLDEALLQRRTSETGAVEPICMNVGRRESRRGGGRQKPRMSPADQSVFCDLVSLHSQVSLSKATSGRWPAFGGEMWGH